jgi:hypothetical protein
MKTDDLYLNRFRGNTGRDVIDFNRDEIGNSQHENRYQSDRKYQCVLKCEGSKTYHQSGYCPDCSMKLVVVGDSHSQH